MRRRKFIVGAFAALQSSLSALAQQRSMPLVGVLRSTPNEPFTELVTALREGLREAGYVEGRNVLIEYRWAENDISRLPALAADLIAQKPAAIVANGPAVRAIRELDGTVPVVFVLGDDPVKRGFVESLNRPGGNSTGVTFFGGGSLNVKRLEFLHELVPPDRNIAVLVDDDYSEREAELPNVEAAARSLGRTITVVRTTASGSLEAAFQEMAKAQAGALLVSGSPSFNARRREVVELAAQYRVPTSYDQRAYVEVGGLMSYGTNFPFAYRQAGIYVARILSGERPTDLPVMQPTMFELALNLRTKRKSPGIAGPSFAPRPRRRGDRIIGVSFAERGRANVITEVRPHLIRT